jgi:1-acyl-sn-glycerol-3-phosphate acyltransferase
VQEAAHGGDGAHDAAATLGGRLRHRWPTAPLEILWSFRHLSGLAGVDWSDARGRDPELIAVLERAFAGAYDRYFRVEVRDWPNVPRGPAVLVGNHSGFGVAELLMLLAAWSRRLGPERPVYALAHRWLYQTPFLRSVIPKIGGVPATWADGCRVLRAGDPLAVFPGGELESTRPFSERYRIQLHGRRGFVRLALANDVPVVPFVTIGSHATMPMPPGMRTLATVTGARRFLGLDAVPLPLQLVTWILAALALDVHGISTSSFWMLIAATPPLYPSKITTRFGPPIPAAELRALAGARGERTADATDHVQARMQAMMDELARERRSLFS